MPKTLESDIEENEMAENGRQRDRRRTVNIG